MTVQIRKARRSATKLRLLLTGPSGSGKTYGALLVAKGLGARRPIVIDTEQGSSDLYDSLLPFDVIDLVPPFTPERYIAAIDAAEKAGADVIVIDSISQEWNGPGGILELSDEVARAKFKGNTWSAWSELTPRHRAFIDRMLRSSAHIIATGRAKTETAQVDDHGRKKVVKLGMRLESRDGAEYEFTTVLDIVHDGHYAVASKDRTGIFTGDPKPISEATGKRLAEWLAGGEPVAVRQEKQQTLTPSDATQDPIGKARLAVSKAGTLDALDKLRTLVELRTSEGTFTQAQHDELVQLMHHKAEMLIGDSGTEFEHEAAEHEVTA